MLEVVSIGGGLWRGQADSMRLEHRVPIQVVGPRVGGRVVGGVRAAGGGGQRGPGHGPWGAVVVGGWGSTGGAVLSRVVV